MTTAVEGELLQGHRGWPVRCLRVLTVALVFAGALQGVATAADPAEQTTPAVEAVEIGAVRAQTGGLLLSGQAGGTIDGALVWSLAGRDEHGRAGVPFVIEVDGGGLLSGDHGPRTHSFCCGSGCQSLHEGSQR